MLHRNIELGIPLSLHHLRLHGPDPMPAQRRVGQLVRHQLVYHQRVVHAIYVEIEPEAEEVVVIEDENNETKGSDARRHARPPRE
jgi:hypothetical protein